MKISHPFQLIFCLQLLGLNIFINADETKLDGASLTKQYCAECHGEHGNAENSKEIPKIAGFSAILIFDTLDQFKNDDRKPIKIKNKNNQLTDMTEISKKLKPEETEVIAHYLSKQKFIPAKNNNKKTMNKKLITQGKQLHEDLCNDCHVENGTSSADDAPILAGQHKAYLTRQFEQFSNRERYIPKRMKRKFRKLNEDDKKALIEFYTSDITQ